jgi:O-antigen ligase
MSQGRLEGIIIPGAEDSNYLAALLGLAIPLGGWLLLVGSPKERMFAFVCLGLTFETILRCNSRGAFLALLTGGAWLLLRSSGRIRKYAFAGILLASLGASLMIKTDTILDRFATTFSSAEKREESAQTRLDYWTCALRMIKDYPFGSGYAAAFKSERGREYLIVLGETRFRAVHNGYLDIAASWGLQGLALYVIAILAVWRGLAGAARQMGAGGDASRAFLGTCIETALVVQLVTSMFLSSFDGEWFCWWMSIALGYRRVFWQSGREGLRAPSIAGDPRAEARRWPGHLPSLGG